MNKLTNNFDEIWSQMQNDLTFSIIIIVIDKEIKYVHIVCIQNTK